MVQWERSNAKTTSIKTLPGPARNLLGRPLRLEISKRGTFVRAKQQGDRHRRLTHLPQSSAYVPAKGPPLPRPFQPKQKGEYRCISDLPGITPTRVPHTWLKENPTLSPYLALQTATHFHRPLEGSQYIQYIQTWLEEQGPAQRTILFSRWRATRGE